MTTLTDVALTDVGLTDVGLTDVGLTDVALTDVDLTDVALTDVDLTDVDLTDVDLTDVALTDVDLTDVALTDVDLTDVDLNLKKYRKRSLENMLVDDIKKAQLLGISYGEYMALKKDFYSNDQEKAVKATAKMAELMLKASEKKKSEMRD